MAARTFGRGLRVIQAYRQSDSEPLPIEELSEALHAMHGAGLTELDTARSYNHGITGRESEVLLGAALATLPPDMAAQFTISTKLSPGQGIDPEPERGFRHGAVLAQGDASRSSLGRDSVLVLYLHSPDLETDLDETLSAVNELHKQGFFQDFGISNFPAWQVMQVYMRCKALGYCLPAVCASPLLHTSVPAPILLLLLHLHMVYPTQTKACTTLWAAKSRRTSCLAFEC